MWLSILCCFYYFLNLLLFSYTQYQYSNNNNYQSEQAQQLFQFRQHHPVGNISTFFGTTSMANTRPTIQQQQSIYLNIGSENYPKSNNIRMNAIVQPSNSVIQQNIINYPCSTRCPHAYRWTTYRWSTNVRSQQSLPNSPTPTIKTLPSVPQPQALLSASTQQPNVHGALVRMVFPSQQIHPFQAIIYPSSSLNKTIETTVLLTTTMMTSTMNPFFQFRTTTNKYQLPTPPPYTQNGAPNVPDTIVRVNPCFEGQPYMNEYHNPTTCNFVVKPNGGCPENYWCHTGSSYETTTCCPNTTTHKDRCQLSRSNGEGDDLIPRWYFDNGSHKCKRFLYKGMRGNANNFVTAMSCAETCEIGEQASVIRNPCAIGQPARNLNGKQFECSTNDNRCPAGYFCHLGELAQTNVCCELSAAASDRCNLALRIGEGTAQLRRYYFNTLVRKCIEFVYRGTKGNENSFLTLDECRSTCEKLPNPCPLLFDFGERKECIGIERRCGKREWCHIGSSKETTACCPAAAVNLCKLPLDLGQGVENLTRWYAVPSEDACSRECRPFQYQGMKGNQNNFLSKTECEATCKADCPVSLNPCEKDEDLLLDPEGRPQRCNGTAQCPADYWCHNGANAETTVCCSVVGHPCAKPLAEGFGNALLSRWYYNAEEANCQKFIYRGIGGNQNNYIDYEECMNACPDFADNKPKVATNISTLTTPLTQTTSMSTTILSSILLNPCDKGRLPLYEESGQPFKCSPDKLCPDTHFCHISDQLALSNQCCPKNGNPCAQARNEGEGQSKLQRFYFDSTHACCHSFIYRGSHGNANNFLTKTDCEYVCLGSSISSLRLNPCSYGKPLTDDSNQPLVCGGGTDATTKENPFLASLPFSGCPNGYWCHVGSSPATTNCCPQQAKDSKSPCELPLELGNGVERLDRWYYDATAQACRRFWYTGLKGNENNFLSRGQCQQYCLQLLIVNLAQQGGLYTNITKKTSTLIKNNGYQKDPNFCARGEPLENDNGKMLKCGMLYVDEDDDDTSKSDIDGCPETHYCHIGYTIAQTGCCTKTGSEPCLLPLHKGLDEVDSRSQFAIRWHYNSGISRCEAFNYSGIAGNENNFLTKKHCEHNCMRKMKMKQQICPHGEPKWMKQQKSNEHVPATCASDKGCPEGYICHLSAELGTAVCCENPAYFCLQAREFGNCDGEHTSYGYNPLTDTCVSYRYSGCGGTLNRFKTLEQCTKICCRQYRKR